MDGWAKLEYQLRELRTAMSVNGPEPIRRKLKEIVPQYMYTTAEERIEAGISVGAQVVRRAVGHQS